jgi:CRP-like cAMP-binding protein
MSIPHLKIFQQAPTYHAKKGEVLVKAGEASNKGFFVVKGCLRSYVVDDKGKEHIYQFAPEDWLIADLEYFKRKEKALLWIDAIEESELKVITLKGGSMIDEVDVTDTEAVKTSLTKLHNRMYALQKRVIQLLSFTAEERYKEFLSTYPNLVQRVPLKMIASYLGVTPESLSRVRKEMVKSGKTNGVNSV